MWRADFESKKVNGEHFIFRYNTEYRTSKQATNVIGLVVMMNPGSALPEDKKNSELLEKCQIVLKKESIKPDPTLNATVKLVEYAYKHNEIEMPKEYVLHIENLCNLRVIKAQSLKENVEKAEKFGGHVFKLLYNSRVLSAYDKKKYHFCFFAWGKTYLNMKMQKELPQVFPNAVRVMKTLNTNGDIVDVKYPFHMLRINRDFNRNKSIFYNAVDGKILPYRI